MGALADEQCTAFASQEEGNGGQQKSDEDGGGRIEVAAVEDLS